MNIENKLTRKKNYSLAIIQKEAHLLTMVEKRLLLPRFCKMTHIYELAI